MPFSSIAVIGLGLIGGSLSRAFAARGIRMFGMDKSPSTLAMAAGTGVFDALTDNLDELLEFEPELVYLCLPVNKTVKYLRLLTEKSVTIPVTDAASTKSTICAEASELQLSFCGGHPIAGKESSGFAASDGGLFTGAYHVLTPGADVEELADSLSSLHESIGMRVTRMQPDEHDGIFGAVSHLPHITAYALVETVENSKPEALAYTGGGFRDFTRIAASDPDMWTDIFLDNASAVTAFIDAYITQLESWKLQIADGDRGAIHSRIEEARNIRRAL